MNKKIIILLAYSAIASNNLFAFEKSTSTYKKINIETQIILKETSDKKNENNKYKYNNSNVNFNFKHYFINNWETGANFKVNSNNDYQLYTDLAYIYGRNHKLKTTIIGGLQESIYGNIAKWTDKLENYGADNLYQAKEINSINATNKADQALSAMQIINKNITIGLLFQTEEQFKMNNTKTIKRLNTISGSLIYNFQILPIKLGGTYNQTKYEGLNTETNYILGLSNSNYSKFNYALTYQENKNTYGSSNKNQITQLYLGIKYNNIDLNLIYENNLQAQDNNTLNYGIAYQISTYKLGIEGNTNKSQSIYIKAIF